MKVNYFNPNWRMINKAINEDGLHDLRLAQKELEKKIQSRVDAFYRAKRQQEEDEKIFALKALPANSIVYFIGRSDKIAFGTPCKKLSDGRKKMKIDVKGSFYTCPYYLLKISEPTDQERRDHNLGVKISALFSKAIKQ
jgi:hypothetical protein